MPATVLSTANASSALCVMTMIFALPAREREYIRSTTWSPSRTPTPTALGDSLTLPTGGTEAFLGGVALVREEVGVVQEVGVAQEVGVVDTLLEAGRTS